MIVSINLNSGQFTFKAPSREILLAEKESGTSFTDFMDAGVKTLFEEFRHLSAKAICRLNYDD